MIVCESTAARVARMEREMEREIEMECAYLEIMGRCYGEANPHIRALATPLQLVIADVAEWSRSNEFRKGAETKRSRGLALHLDNLRFQRRACDLAHSMAWRGGKPGALPVSPKYGPPDLEKAHASLSHYVETLTAQHDALCAGKPWPPIKQAAPFPLLIREQAEIASAEARLLALGQQPPARPTPTKGQSVPQMRQVFLAHLGELQRLERASKPPAPPPAPPAPPVLAEKPPTLSALVDAISAQEAAARERGAAVPARPIHLASLAYADVLKSLTAHLATLQIL